MGWRLGILRLLPLLGRCGYGAAMVVSPEQAVNMAKARRITGGLLIENPVESDPSADYVAVQAWPLVIALYTGIEQALKMLLLTPPSPRFSREELKSPKFGHNLKKLYSKIETADRDHIELHFREHRSLHDYRTPGFTLETAEQFIAHINGTKTPHPTGKKQSGAVSWRYILLDGIEEVPRTSLWTMYETWGAICCCIRREVLDNPDDCFRLSQRLVRECKDLLVPQPYDEFVDDLNSWVAQGDGSLLAAWTDLLVKANIGTLHEVRTPDRLRPELMRMANRALKQMASDSADPDEVQLLHRIQTDPNLTWDQTTASFRSWDAHSPSIQCNPDS